MKSRDLDKKNHINFNFYIDGGGRKQTKSSLLSQVAISAAASREKPLYVSIVSAFKKYILCMRNTITRGCKMQSMPRKSVSELVCVCVCVYVDLDERKKSK